MNVISSNRTQVLLYILGGIIFGIFLLLIFSNPNQWTWLSFASILVFWVVVISPDHRLMLLVLFVLFIPLHTDLIFNYRLHPGGAKGWTISLIDIPLIFLYIIWLIEISIHRKNTVFFLPGIILPYFGFVLLAIFSLIKAQDVSLGLFQIFILIKKLLAIIYIANHVKNNKTLNRILIALFLGALFESIIGVLQYTTCSNLGLYILGERNNELDLFLTDNHEGIPRASGTFWHSNGFAFYLQLVLPLGVGVFLLGTKGFLRYVMGILIILALIGLILTFSRGAWISFLISFCCLVILFCRKVRINSNIIRLLMGSLLVITVIFFVFGKLISTRLTSEDDGAAYSRIPMMKTAWNIIKHHPLLGIGINNYAETMSEYDETGHRFSQNRPVHNLFLLIAAETGVLGFGFFFWMIAAVFWKALKTFNQVNGLHAGTILGIICGLIGFLVHAQVDFVLLDYMNIFWLYLGLVCALSYHKFSDY